MSFLGNTASSHISKPEWEGNAPCRFRGGRQHNNHPTDELDHLLVGDNTSQAKPLGPSKRRIYQGQTMEKQVHIRPHLRTFEQSNKSNVVFSVQDLPKLIKIPKSQEYSSSISPIFRNSKIGQSKLKNLQNGKLKSGIYRNFYKSQFKQQPFQKQLSQAFR